jgi:hypothetical protein
LKTDFFFTTFGDFFFWSCSNSFAFLASSLKSTLIIMSRVGYDLSTVLLNSIGDPSVDLYIDERAVGLLILKLFEIVRRGSMT